MYFAKHCRFFNETTEVWSTNGCHVVNRTEVNNELGLLFCVRRDLSVGSFLVRVLCVTHSLTISML